jgi:hypothetical protein
MLQAIRGVPTRFGQELRISHIGCAALACAVATCAIFPLRELWSRDFELRGGLLSWGALILIGNWLTFLLAFLSLVAERGKMPSILSLLLLALIERYWLPLIGIMVFVNFFPLSLIAIPVLVVLALLLRRSLRRFGQSAS